MFDGLYNKFIMREVPDWVGSYFHLHITYAAIHVDILVLLVPDQPWDCVSRLWDYCRMCIEAQSSDLSFLPFYSHTNLN